MSASRQSTKLACTTDADNASLTCRSVLCQTLVNKCELSQMPTSRTFFLWQTRRCVETASNQPSNRLIVLCVRRTLIFHKSVRYQGSNEVTGYSASQLYDSKTGLFDKIIIKINMAPFHSSHHHHSSP